MKQKLLCSAISAVLLAGASTTAMAQLEEVVVTAQKREQSANDIGMAISTLSGDAMQELRVLDSTDLAVAIPGLTYADTGLSVPVYTLRGVGFNEESVQAAATVGVYNDQIGLPFPIMTRGLLMDNERVEVLKGPQGTLFGRNSTGGAINFIANKPTDELEASVTAGYSRFETADLEGFVSGPITDSVRGRIAARTIQSGEGWQKSVSRDDDHGEYDKYSLRGLLAIDVTDSIDLLLRADYWEDNSDSMVPSFQSPAYQGLFGSANPIVEGLLDTGDNARVSTLNEDDNRDADWAGGNNRLGGAPELDMNTRSFSATLNWAINDTLTLTSLTSYSKFENDSTYQNDGFGGMPTDKTFGGLTAQDTIAAVVRDQYDAYDELGHSHFTNDSEIESWFQELRIQGEYDNLTWIIGANYADDDVNTRTQQIVDVTTNTNISFFPFPGEIGLQTVDNISQQDGTTWAVFGHTEWQFADDWKLTLGLRYDEDEKDFKGCTGDNGDGDTSQYIATLVEVSAGIVPDVEPGGCITFPEGSFTGSLIEKNLDEDSTSGKVALDWNVTDDILTYASYSRGYKSGSFPTLSTNAASQLDPVVQEKVDAYEVGMKARFADGAAQLNAAAFYYDYTDKQLLGRVPTIFGALGALVNVPESEVTGAEFDLQWAPVDGLVLGLAATYLDTKVKDFENFNQLGQPQDFDGSDFPLTPEWQGTAMARYEWSLANGMTAHVSGDVSYSDDFISDYEGQNGLADPAFDLDGATLYGARAGISSADERWSAVLWGRNLSDEFQPLNTRKLTDGLVRFTGQPRTYGVSFTYNWL
ncbi:MAG: TonB-dependent receptor [Halieaceae bacterium]